MTNADIRRNWHEQAAKVFAAEHRRDAYEVNRAVHWERIEASRHGPLDRELDEETYGREKMKLADCESKIAKLDFLIGIRRSVWDVMPTPKPRKQRARLISADGYVRTGKFKMIDGERVPVLEKIE
jgi:hypothetical protein